MPSPAESSAAAGAVREAIDLQRFPWIRPLVREYATNYDRVAPLFAGNPADPSAWPRTIERVTGARRNRDAISAALLRQLDRRGAPAEAKSGAAALTTASSVAIVTGQEAGMFGGPLYTLMKAVTAIRVARHVTSTYGVQAVPVFWVESEDHDWAEIRSAHVLDKDGAPALVTAPDMPGAGKLSVAALTFTDGIREAVARLQDLLPPTEFTRELADTLNRRYCPDAHVGAAFAGFLDDLLGPLGLVVFEAADPSVKPLVADILSRELENPRAAAIAREAGAQMTSLGHAPQFDSTEDGIGVFYLDESGRRGVKRRGSDYAVGETSRPIRDLVAEATAHPDRFGPNVLLRPIVQDRLFPTLAYITGPSELAYQAQIGELYREHGVPRPLLFNRASATIIDSAAARFFERSGLAFEALQPRDDAALNRLLELQLPAGLERGLADADRAIADSIGSLKAAIAAVDPTLTGAVDTTLDRMRESLKTLQSKVIQAAKRKDDTLRRQFVRTRNLVFPDGAPQERALSVAYFVNRYGPTLGQRLLNVIPIETDKHYVITL